MEAKAKAKELVNQFLEKIPFADKNVYEDWKKEMNDKAKQCALIAVDEILDAITFNMYDEDAYNKEDNYWQEVKQEIELL